MENDKTQKFQVALPIAFFIILFYGLRLGLEHCFFEDELPLTYKLAIVFGAGVLSAVYAFIMKRKTLKTHVVVLIVTLVVVVVFNFLAR